jgi:hypothetical protein
MFPCLARAVSNRRQVNTRFYVYWRCGYWAPPVHETPEESYVSTDNFVSCLTVSRHDKPQALHATA